MRNPKCLINAANGNVEFAKVIVTGVTHVIFAKRSYLNITSDYTCSTTLATCPTPVQYVQNNFPSIRI
jgi:hypothetical protein